MSRAAFARLTGFGEATLARWERGEVIQNTSNDSFLRLLMNNDAMERLSRMTQYEDKLGRKFSMVYDRLQNDSASALTKYNELQELFGTAEQVRLLKAIGGRFFWGIQQMSWSDLMLRLTKLTDPPKSAGKDNLTIQILPDLCEESSLREEVGGLVQEAVDAAAFARDWRNRHISHSDLAQAIAASPEPLAKANLRKVKAALDAVHAVLNSISVRLLDAGMQNMVVDTAPGASAFLARVGQVVDAVQYIDSVIDPSGAKPTNNREVADAFLQKLGRTPTWQERRRVFGLRRAAHRFK